MDEQSVKIKLTNHLTGEVTEVEVKSADQAKNLYLELAASATVIDKAKTMLRHYLDNWLGQDEQQDFVDGHYVKRVQRTSLIYRPEVVRKYLKENLDRDTYDAAMEVITKIDQTAADLLISEYQSNGQLPAETLKKIRSEADIKATVPYIEVR